MIVKAPPHDLEFWRMRRDALRLSVLHRLAAGELQGQYRTAAEDALQMVTGLIAQLETKR